MLAPLALLLLGTTAARGVGKSTTGVPDPVPVQTADPRAPADQAEYFADRYPSLAAAVSAAGSAGTRLVVSTPADAAGVTFPPTLTLELRGAGQLTGSGTTTINGPFIAPTRPVFAPTLTVTLGLNVPTVYPEWWGVAGDGSTDDATSFAKMLASLPQWDDKWSEAGGTQNHVSSVVNLGNKVYRMGSEITLSNTRNIHFRGHAAYSARFLWGGAEGRRAYFFKFNDNSNAHVIFENAVFDGAGVEAGTAVRGKKSFIRCLFEAAPEWGFRTLGISVIGLLFDECRFANVGSGAGTGGINIAFSQSDLILIRRTVFTRTHGVPIKTSSSDITIEECEFETNRVDGTLYENPYIWVANVGRVRILNSRFGNENFGGSGVRYDHPRSAIVVGNSLTAGSAGSILSVLISGNEFLGSANNSANIAHSAVKFTNPPTGARIYGQGRVQLYNSFLIDETYRAGGVDAGSALSNSTDLRRGVFSHGGAGFTFEGEDSPGDAHLKDGLLARQNLLKGSTDFSGWMKTKVTAVANVTGPDGVANSGVTVSRTAPGAAYTHVSSDASVDLTGLYAVFSVWARAGTETRMRLVIASTGITTNHSPKHNTFTLTDGWQRYYAVAPYVPGAQVAGVIYSGDDSDAARSGDFYVFGPQLEIGHTPSPYIPTPSRGVHAEKQLQSLMLGGKYVGWGTAAPASGYYDAGDLIFNTAPTAGGFVGWVCITAGTPGTWRPFGAISP